MGMYTEIYVNVDLKEDTPECAIKTIKAVCEGDWEQLGHEGRPSRWAMLFGNGSCYTPNTEVSELTCDGINEGYSLLGKGDIKNYGSEIEEFFEFIAPHVESHPKIPTFIGYMRYEEQDMPTLAYVYDNGVHYQESIIRGNLA